MNRISSNWSLTIRLILVALPVATLVSCGSSDPDLKPVSGHVTHKGQHLADAVVRFIPAGGTIGVGGVGKTDAEGTYQITYAQGGEGLLPGAYKVTVSKRVMPDGSAPPEDVDPIESPARETLPPRYSHEETTRLTKTVPDVGGTIDIELE
jgi:hypothetical protein